MIKIDWSLVVQIVNFLVLMIALNAVLFRPIRSVIKERKDKYAGFEAAISDLTARADERVREIDARLTEARRDGFVKKDRLKGEGLDEEKRIVDAATEETDARVHQVKERIRGEVATARKGLKEQMETFSMELAEKVLGRSLS